MPFVIGATRVIMLVREKRVQLILEGMWLMLQQDAPQDFILATGKTRTVRQFAEQAFAVVGKELKWKGEGLDEIGIDSATSKTVVRVDPKCLRPTDVDRICGDATKARDVLGWVPKTDFNTLVAEMVMADLEE